MEGDNRRLRVINDIANTLTADWYTGGACRHRRWTRGWLLTELWGLGCDVTRGPVYLELITRAGLPEQPLNRMGKQVWWSRFPWFQRRSVGWIDRHFSLN